MTFRLLPSLALIFGLALATPAVELSVVPDRDTGVYEPGQAVTWTITAKDAAPADLKYTVKAGGATQIAEGVLSFADNKATVTATLNEPGTLLLSVPHDQKNSFGGAAYAWEKIPASAEEPKDFDAFWKSKLDELAKVPVDATFEPADSGVPGVVLQKITMGNIRGSKIYGYFARPAGDKPCPAMLQVQYAGVYALKKNSVVDQAKNGWMVLNIIAHDLPVDESDDFYKKQSDGPLKDYTRIGADDRETSYFLRMYLSCYRAADYLANRPDWNKQTLLVQGGSQGGLQAIVTAGLHPAITSATANVPAGCDHTGADLKRSPGWPGLVNKWSGKDEAKLRTASMYYDVVNFARRVKCPTMIGMGLIDTTCPAPGVFAAYNQITAPKRIIIMPNADHMGDHKAYYGALWGWWNSAKDGKAPPLK
ncbi:MAG: acetylxylan esterase [Planctomycetes bacterium]|nr:acetylxylan esterase [Planctomycetota bacterium]